MPKDNHGDLCSSENYRGICLCSAINKLLEWIIIDRNKDKLETSGLQFSFKQKHSTVMSSLALKEVVNYYWNRDLKVYGCFIDASKAFDRIKYDKLFKLLIKRQMHPIMIRLFVDMYVRQKSRTIWDNEYGEYFGSSNGVRQGGISSPLIFTVYVDELIMRLKKSGIGCYVGHEFYGCLGYADDFKLLCPSVKGLRKMLHICEEFGNEYSVIYNSKKTVCIKCSIVSNHREQKPEMSLNSEALSWAECVKDLGNHIRSDLSEAKEIQRKQGSFIGRTNSLLIKYSDANPEVLMKLLSSYCTHLYGAQAWNFNDKNVVRIVSTWNRAIRKIWNLPYDSHTIYLCALNEGIHVWDVIFRRFLKMYTCIETSSNSKLSFLAKLSREDNRSILATNTSFICRKMNVCKNMLLNNKNIIYEKYMYNVNENEECVRTVHMIKELNEGVEGFSKDEICDILNYITTL